MSLWEYFDRRAHRLGILDTKLAQAAAIFFVLTVVKLVPAILEIGVGWFAALAILCAIRPAWTFFGPAHDSPGERLA